MSLLVTPNPRPRPRAFSLVVLVILALAGSAFAAPFDLNTAPSASVMPDGTRVFGQGSARYIENIPIIRLAGSYREMGFQYGVLMKGN